MDLLIRFKNVIIEQNLVHKDDKILIAVSGGVDSVVLLHLFYCIRDEYNLTLKIIHVNHGIRGEEADRDQTFVQQLSDQYNLPVSLKRVNVPQYIESQKRSLEEGARILRYQSFNEELEESNFDYLALGHNANDQAETILDHFIRGSGVRGLSGMKYIRHKFIRPLLAFTRTDIETYALKMRLNYVTDTTNKELTYKRNKIRHQLIPFLQKEFNPNIVNTSLNTGFIFKQIDIFLKTEAKKAYAACLKSYKKNKIILDIDLFFNYFNIVQVYVLYYILELISIDENVLSFHKITSFMNFLQKRRIGAKFSLSPEWKILIDRNVFIFYQSDENEFEFEISLKRKYKIYESEKIFIAELINRDQMPKTFSSEKNLEYIDYDKVEGQLSIRNYRPGDRFVPLNMTGHKKVSDFFTDEKIPLHIRSQIPLLTCFRGIIWIVGYRIDDRFKITNNSKRILKLEMREVNNGE